MGEELFEGITNIIFTNKYQKEIIDGINIKTFDLGKAISSPPAFEIRNIVVTVFETGKYILNFQFDSLGTRYALGYDALDITILLQNFSGGTLHHWDVGEHRWDCSENTNITYETNFDRNVFPNIECVYMLPDDFFFHCC